MKHKSSQVAIGGMASGLCLLLMFLTVMIPFSEYACPTFAGLVLIAVAEEMGLIVALCLIMVCLSCFIMFMNISMRMRDRFYQLVAFGIGVLYIFQIFLTVGGDTKFIPMTGVTLPLVSYGGSSVMTTLMMFAIIEGLYIIRQGKGAANVEKRNKYAGGRRKERTAAGERTTGGSSAAGGKSGGENDREKTEAENRQLLPAAEQKSEKEKETH